MPHLLMYFVTSNGEYIMCLFSAEMSTHEKIHEATGRSVH
jgi:hypothetical protein